MDWIRIFFKKSARNEQTVRSGCGESGYQETGDGGSGSTGLWGFLPVPGAEEHFPALISSESLHTVSLHFHLPICSNTQNGRSDTFQL